MPRRLGAQPHLSSSPGPIADGRRALRPREQNGAMRMGVAATTVGALLAAMVGFWYGWHGSDVDPSPPAAVCPMGRSELFDRLIPQHSPPSEERFRNTGVPGTPCTGNRPHG